MGQRQWSDWAMMGRVKSQPSAGLRITETQMAPEEHCGPSILRKRGRRNYMVGIIFFAFYLTELLI